MSIKFFNASFSKPATTIGVMGGLSAIVMQVAPKLGLLGDSNHSKQKTILRRTIRETNFVTLWVIFAYLAFELPIYFFDINIEGIFAGWAAIVPLISVLIGFLPDVDRRFLSPPSLLQAICHYRHRLAMRSVMMGMLCSLQ